MLVFTIGDTYMIYKSTKEFVLVGLNLAKAEKAKPFYGYY